MPRVSVIIPTYNRQHTVCRAIDSVLAQTFQDFEVVVVDDGSTDNTREKLEVYGDTITYVYQANAGAAVARNTGISVANGELINFLDSDDWFEPEKLARQVAYLDSHPACDIVLCGWREHNVDSGLAEEYGLTLPVDDIVEAILLTGNNGLFTPHVALVHRRCLESVGGFDTALAMREEQDLWLRLGLAGWKFGHISAILCDYEFGPSGKGKVRGPRLEQAMATIHAKVFDHPQTPLYIQALKNRVLATSHVDSALYYLEQQPVLWEQAQEHLARAFNDAADIHTWGHSFFDPLAYTAIELDPNQPEQTIAKMLAKADHRSAWLYTEIATRIHLIRAHEAYADQDYQAVVRHLLQGSIHDVGQLREPGTLAILARSILKLPVSLRRKVHDLMSGS